MMGGQGGGGFMARRRGMATGQQAEGQFIEGTATPAPAPAANQQGFRRMMMRRRGNPMPG